MGAPALTPFGVAVQIGVPAPDSKPFFLGTGSDASFQYDGTNLVINPKAVGAGNLTLGSATGAADADLILNKIGLGNSAISSTAMINGMITSTSARSMLNFDLTYTGSNNSATLVIGILNEQGTGASFTGTAFLSQMKPALGGHATAANYYGLYAQGGFISDYNTSGGTHSQYGVRVELSLMGNGSSSTTGGTYRRYGFYQANMGAIAGAPSSDLIMGYFGQDSINITASTKMIFDSTNTVLGDTYLTYSAALTGLRTFVDNVEISRHDQGGFKLPTLGTGLFVKEGANATMGRAVLGAGGVVVVPTTKVTATSEIFITSNVDGVVANIAYVRVSARVVGASFTITSLNVLDNCTISWIIIEPA